MNVGELLLWEPVRCLGVMDDALAQAAEVVYRGQEDTSDMVRHKARISLLLLRCLIYRNTAYYKTFSISQSLGNS